MAKNVTPKDLRLAVKHGLTLAEVAKKYGFQDDEELKEYIIRISISSQYARDLIKALTKNQKKPHNATADDDLADQEDVQTETEDTDVTTAELSNEPEEVENMETTRRTITLEELRKQETELSQQLSQSEKEHDCDVTKRREVQNELEQAKLQLMKMLTEFSQIKEKVERLKNEFNEAESSMAKANEEISALRSLLKEVRQQIEEKKKIAIFIYNGGNIDLDGEGIPEVSTVECNTFYFENVVVRPDVDDFTGKEMKTLTRCFLIAKKLIEQGVSFEIAFESELMESVFNSLIEEFRS